MNGESFSVSGALRFGWETFKRNLGLSIGITVVGLAAVLLLQGLSQATQHYAGLTIGFAIISGIVRVLWGLVWIRFALALHDGELVHPRDLVPDGKAFLNYLAVSIVFGVIVWAGLILLIVPGIYLAVRYGFANFLVAEGRTDVLDAFRQSSVLTRGERWRLFVLDLALVALNIAGLLAVGIGLLVTIPVSVFAFAMVYRRLQSRAEQYEAFPVGTPWPAPV